MRLSGDKCFELANDVIYIAKLERRLVLGDIEEFFAHNVDNYKEYFYEYRTTRTRYDGILSRLCTFDFKDSPYELVVNRDTKEFDYYLMNDVDPFTMSEATRFHFLGIDKVEFRKKQLNANGFFIEKYKAGVGIETIIYNTQGVENVIYDSLINGSDEGLKDISDNITCVIKVAIASNGKDFVITVINTNGTPIEPIKTISYDYGMTLYSVYYDYMIEKGYFVGDGQKEGEIKKAKTGNH